MEISPKELAACQPRTCLEPLAKKIVPGMCSENEKLEARIEGWEEIKAGSRELMNSAGYGHG